jgi:uncharacterized membrane protein
MNTFALYVHILSATAWVGGSLLLFALGVTIKEKSVQTFVYDVIGPIYGYFESFWLVLLVVTGGYLIHQYGIFDLVGTPTPLGQLLQTKLYLVISIVVATTIHMGISLSQKNPTFWQKTASRSASFLIFLLNLIVVWYAMIIRDTL